MYVCQHYTATLCYYVTLLPILKKRKPLINSATVVPCWCAHGRPTCSSKTTILSLIVYILHSTLKVIPCTYVYKLNQQKRSSDSPPKFESVNCWHQQSGYSVFKLHQLSNTFWLRKNTLQNRRHGQSQNMCWAPPPYKDFLHSKIGTHHYHPTNPLLSHIMYICYSLKAWVAV